MKPKQRWIVNGWLEGSSFDNAYKADYAVIVEADTEEEADEKGDAKLREEFGTCDVIVSIKFEHYSAE